MSRKYGMIDHDLVGNGVTDDTAALNLGTTFKLKEVIYVEDFGVKAHLRELDQALKFALSTGYPVRVGGKSYWIQGGSTRAKETDINKLKAEWFARGQRHEREKMQAELRRLLGIDEFEEGVG